MSAFTIIQGVSDSLQQQAYLKSLREEEARQRVAEQKNIDDDQIRSGMGKITDTEYLVPYDVVRKLNELPNPERNGLVLLWAYNIYRICGGIKDKMMDFITQVYQAGIVELEPTATQSEAPGPKQRGRKPKAASSEAEGKFELRKEAMPNVSQVEYERLKAFSENCLIFGIKQSISERKKVDFYNLAINLLKGVREVSLTQSSAN